MTQVNLILLQICRLGCVTSDLLFSLVCVCGKNFFLTDALGKKSICCWFLVMFNRWLFFSDYFLSDQLDNASQQCGERGCIIPELLKKKTKPKSES